ncbi:MAG TPA: UDP-N-acetylmuramoyl-tripeptide--D-alanyl-D-alanine ligase, partial [Dehalococcoidia bacterium]|nr:UDP-N-acetylmuramoyl-tripeptide--D-alanyl-D-alanine ligase [Dehalococcoidia bacterium]
MSFRKVAIDSRLVQPGDIFFALRGEKDDGHNYVLDALQRGAQGVVVEREVQGILGANIWRLNGLALALATMAPPFAFLVEDTLQALQKLSAYHRAQYPCRAIGVTGSLGKTTAKEAIWAVLKERYVTLRSQGNFNSEIGLPLTLLEIGPQHQRVVLEMGMYALGEIRLLCELAKPECGLVTNVGPVHLERLGSLEAIARAKAELVEALPRGGVAFLNGDDPWVRAMAQHTRASTFTFGLQPENDLYADGIESRGLAGISFRLHHQGEAIPVASPLRGRESIWACLAGAAVGQVEGLGWEEIVRGLGSAIEQPRLR